MTEETKQFLLKMSKQLRRTTRIIAAAIGAKSTTAYILDAIEQCNQRNIEKYNLVIPEFIEAENTGCDEARNG